MSKRYLEHEAWDDDEDDGDFDEHPYDEDPTDEDRDDDFEADDENDETDPCPHCGASVYYDAEQCPHCGEYLSREDAPASGKPLWLVITALVLAGLFAIACLR